MSEHTDLLERLADSQKACFDRGLHIAAMDIQSAREFITKNRAAPTTSPEPDAVREQIARIIDPNGWKTYDYWVKESPIGVPKEDDRRRRHLLPSLEKAADIFAALSRPAHGGWEDLRETLQNVRAAIMEADPAVLCDTLWMPQRISPAETAVDHIDLALARNDRGSADNA